MKTAIQNLYQKILIIPNIQHLPMSMVLEITTEFNASLLEEKQQIIDAHNKGQQYYNSGYNPTVSEQYYISTFTTNNENLK